MLWGLLVGKYNLQTDVPSAFVSLAPVAAGVETAAEDLQTEILGTHGNEDDTISLLSVDITDVPGTHTDGTASNNAMATISDALSLYDYDRTQQVYYTGTQQAIYAWGVYFDKDWGDPRDAQWHSPIFAIINDLDIPAPPVIIGEFDPPLTMASGDVWRLDVTLELVDTGPDTPFTDTRLLPPLPGDTATASEGIVWGNRGLTSGDQFVATDAALWFQPTDSGALSDQAQIDLAEMIGIDQATASESWFRPDLGEEQATVTDTALVLGRNVQVETWDWTADRRYYLRWRPTIQYLARFVQVSMGRAYDAEGRALLLRILRATLAASHDLQPPVHYPQAHHATFGLLRRTLWQALYSHIGTIPTGSDGPLLSGAAADALAILETQDRLITIPPNRIATLDQLLLGITWRAD